MRLFSFPSSAAPRGNCPLCPRLNRNTATSGQIASSLQWLQREHCVWQTFELLALYVVLSPRHSVPPLCHDEVAAVHVATAGADSLRYGAPRPVDCVLPPVAPVWHHHTASGEVTSRMTVRSDQSPIWLLRDNTATAMLSFQPVCWVYGVAPSAFMLSYFTPLMPEPALAIRNFLHLDQDCF